MKKEEKKHEGEEAQAGAAQPEKDPRDTSIEDTPNPGMKYVFKIAPVDPKNTVQIGSLLVDGKVVLVADM